MLRGLFLLASLCGAVAFGPMARADAPAVVYLHGGRDSKFPDGAGTYEGLLARELVRQALLGAARDELSCSTLDAHLRQSVPAGLAPLDIVVIRGRGGNDPQPTEFKIYRGEQPAQEEVASEVVNPKSPVDIADLVRMLELRSRGSFVKHLQQAGIAGKARPWVKKLTPSEESASALAQMGFVSQFRAACLLHTQIERDGRSPELIAALSRAYANLAVLTELHWSPAHKVFAARSLLYAQRLVAGKHDNTHAYTSRAYALALAGLHQSALNDLDALDKLIGEGKAERTELPSILRSFCMFHIAELDTSRCEPQHVELVNVLRLLAREYGGSPRLLIEEAMAVSKAMRHCYRAQQSLVLQSGVSLGHMTTIQGPVNTGRTLYPALQAFADIPAEVRVAIQQPSQKTSNPIDEFGKRANTIALLQANESAVGRQGQLTWQVLGQLLVEHSFAEVYARASFEKKKLGSDADPFLDLAKPLYDFHPLAAVMDFLRRDRTAAEQTLARATVIDLDTVEIQARDLSAVVPLELTAEAKRRQQEVTKVVLNHADYTARDLLQRYPYWASRAVRDTERAYQLSPHAPAVRSHMIAHHWKKIEPKLDEWIREAEGDAGQLAAIGMHYKEEKDWDKAVEYLQKAGGLSPEIDKLRLLADVHKARGDISKWQSTLEELVQQPDFGLDHAKIRAEIADHYMSRHEYAKALPAALEAAKTGAEWGMLLAAECYEALQQWQQAETMFGSAAQGYQNFHWLYFVRRTGHGDVDSAKRAAQSYLAGYGGTRIPLFHRHIVYRALGDITKATATLEECYKQVPDLGHGLNLAMLADERKDVARRDQILAELSAQQDAKKAKTPSVGLAVLLEAFAKDLAAGGKADFDPLALLSAKVGAPAAEASALEYLLGKYLITHGKSEAGENIWLGRMATNNMRDLHRTLCGMELLARDIGPDRYKDELLKVTLGDSKGPHVFNK